MSDDIDLHILADSFAEFLGAEWPKDKAIAHEHSGEAGAGALWSGMAGLGWTALTVSEPHGGLGLGMDAAALLHAALGAVTAPVPMLGTTLAATLLLSAGAEAAGAEYLPRVADGSLRIALSQPDAAPLVTDGRNATGIATYLLDAPSADLLLLRALRDGQPCWVAIDVASPGVAIERRPLADASRSLGDVRLNAAPVATAGLIVLDDPGALEGRLLRDGCIALAADSLGGGEAVLAGTVDYLKTREQFGRVIGSFQALKHRAADHQTALIGARELVMHAAALPPDDPDALIAALSAKAHVTRTVAEIARDCIQLFGGVGFTSEYFPHLYLKRAKLNEALFGTRIALLDRVADMLEAA